MITENPPTTLAAHQSNLHSHCVLCGADHPQGFRLAFSTHTDGHVEAPFRCDKLYQGYTGYLHGGIIAALLDSAMTNCLFAHSRTALTGELNVRFLNPVVVNRPATVSARLVESFPPVFCMEAEISQNGRIMARAKAKFMEAGAAGVFLPQPPGTQ